MGYCCYTFKFDLENLSDMLGRNCTFFRSSWIAGLLISNNGFYRITAAHVASYSTSEFPQLRFGYFLLSSGKKLWVMCFQLINYVQNRHLNWQQISKHAWQSCLSFPGLFLLSQKARWIFKLSFPDIDNWIQFIINLEWLFYIIHLFTTLRFNVWSSWSIVYLQRITITLHCTLEVSSFRDCVAITLEVTLYLDYWADNLFSRFRKFARYYDWTKQYLL